VQGGKNKFSALLETCRHLPGQRGENDSPDVVSTAAFTAKSTDQECPVNRALIFLACNFTACAAKTF